MDEQARQTRWLFLLRLLTLAVALVLLPGRFVPGPGQYQALALWLVGAALIWSTPLWGPAWRREAVLGAGAALEALAISGLVALFGRLESPFALLYLPLLGQAAAMLRPAGYLLVAAYVLAAYAGAVAPAVARANLPDWAPVLALGPLLIVAWLGLLGSGFRRESARAHRLQRSGRRYRGLVARVPEHADDEIFWRELLERIEAQGHFVDGALVRWAGPRARVVASDRQSAWEALVRRHDSLLRREVLDAARPQILVETLEGRPSRTIVCWPVARPLGQPGALGMICLLADGTVDEREAGRRLRRYLPLARLTLALAEAPLGLQRAPVDWRTLMNVTLHRLHRRLAAYLVLVHVDEGVIRADALLLADAIAQVVEDALERVPPQSQVRLSVRHRPDGWHFQVETAAAQPIAARAPSPGLLRAQQVVAAHGGEWQAVGGENGSMVGFTLPAAAPADSRSSG